MKRLAISLDTIAGRNNLLLAVHKAARGKRQYPEIAHFLANLEAQLAQLAANIQNGSAPTGQYRSFTIHDPKRRQIHAACFADRVLHHAILNLAEPRFETMLVDTSYACRPGKGVHAAVAQVQRNLCRFPWVVQVDVASYFPHICHATLKDLLATRFKGAAFLALLRRIIDMGSASYGSPTGLPIGALTSQHFANAYLDVADRWLLAQPGVGAHVRYMDDIAWWCHSRAAAEQSLAEFAQFLYQTRGLRLKPQAQVFASNGGMAYCGFRVQQGVILPSRRKLGRYRQHMGLIEQAILAGQCSEVQIQRASDNAHSPLAHCHSIGFRKNYWAKQKSGYDDAVGPNNDLF